MPHMQHFSLYCIASGSIPSCCSLLHDLLCALSCHIPQLVLLLKTKTTKNKILSYFFGTFMHYDRKWHMRVMFVGYSSGFNTIVPFRLISKLKNLGLNRKWVAPSPTMGCVCACLHLCRGKTMWVSVPHCMFFAFTLLHVDVNHRNTMWVWCWCR